MSFELGREPSVLWRWRGLADGAGQPVAAVRPSGATIPAKAEQLERDAQKNIPSASSRARLGEVPFHRGPMRGVPRAGDVFRAAGQRWQLTRPANPLARRLVRPIGKCPCLGDLGSDGGHLPHGRRQPEVVPVFRTGG